MLAMVLRLSYTNPPICQFPSARISTPNIFQTTLLKYAVLATEIQLLSKYYHIQRHHETKSTNRKYFIRKYLMWYSTWYEWHVNTFSTRVLPDIDILHLPEIVTALKAGDGHGNLSHWWLYMYFLCRCLILGMMLSTINAWSGTHIYHRNSQMSLT